MTLPQIEGARNAIDGTLGLGAVTSPFWLSWVENGLGIFMLVGGAVLLTLRLMITWRQWRAGKQDDE